MDKCIRCNNTRRYIGNGFMMTDCELCADSQYISNDTARVDKPIDKVDRRSKSYKDAINEIMRTSKVNRAEATKLFDESYKSSS